MQIVNALALAGLAAAAPSYPSTTPGGALPAGVQTPNTAGFANATVQPSRGGRAVCVSGTVSVSANTTQNKKLHFTVPANQSGVTETFLELVIPGSPFMQQIMGGSQNVSGTWDIASTLCLPAGARPSKVQFLTHGIGFDRFYWDFAPGYSYVDAAVDAGYATFSYDRLGVGHSSKPTDGLNIVQAPLEVAIATALAGKVRRGELGSLAFDKVIGVGHSFGSAISEAITAQSPTVFDGAILTGFSMNMTGLPAFVSGLNLALASNDQPYRFAGLNDSYLVGAGAIGNQIAFFKSPGFDPEIAAQANAQKGTVTYGELFTQAAIAMPAKEFKGPVMIVNGFEDLPFCFGNCTYPVDKPQAAIKALYPAAVNTSTYLAQQAGHGVNLHYSALGAYHAIQDFVKANKL